MSRSVDQPSSKLLKPWARHSISCGGWWIHLLRLQLLILAICRDLVHRVSLYMHRPSTVIISTILEVGHVHAMQESSGQHPLCAICRTWPKAVKAEKQSLRGPSFKPPLSVPDSGRPPRPKSDERPVGVPGKVDLIRRGFVSCASSVMTHKYDPASHL